MTQEARRPCKPKPFLTALISPWPRAPLSTNILCPSAIAPELHRLPLPRRPLLSLKLCADNEPKPPHPPVLCSFHAHPSLYATTPDRLPIPPTLTSLSPSCLAPSKSPLRSLQSFVPSIPLLRHLPPNPLAIPPSTTPHAYLVHVAWRLFVRRHTIIPSCCLFVFLILITLIFIILTPFSLGQSSAGSSLLPRLLPCNLLTLSVLDGPVDGLQSATG